VEDRLLVGMLHTVADADEQLEPLADSQPFPIAVCRHGNTVDILHDKIRVAVRCRAAIEDLRNCGVVHPRQGQPLRIETRNKIARAHPAFNEL
jgi:hypothetical protein